MDGRLRLPGGRPKCLGDITDETLDWVFPPLQSGSGNVAQCGGPASLASFGFSTGVGWRASRRAGDRS